MSFDLTHELITIFLISIAWGSFLNSFSYRIAFDKSLLKVRSYCPACSHTIAWYDNIPIISWLLLRGHCRHCSAPISWIYPFIELVTATAMTSLFLKIQSTPIANFWSLASFIAYFFFFSALIAATITDLMAMVIPQLFSVWLIPVGVIMAAGGLLNINHIESIIGSVIGYGLFWSLSFIFKKIMHKEGLGMGDVEFLSMIGAFTGPVGVWATLMVASVSGLIIGGSYLYFANLGSSARIPFGPFLALGAILYVLLQDPILKFLLL